MNTVLALLHALLFIRLVLTLGYTVAHLVLVYTLLPMGALELICLYADIGRQVMSLTFKCVRSLNYLLVDAI